MKIVINVHCWGLENGVKTDMNDVWSYTLKFIGEQRFSVLQKYWKYAFNIT